MAISREMNNAATSAPKRSMRNQHGMAFFIEALVVLAFLMLAMAVFAQLFAGAQVMSLKANRLSEAITLATNRAEEFSADPTGVAASSEEDGLVITCDVSPSKEAAGTLYEASITVTDGGAEVYRLQTARYVSKEGAK